MRKLLEELFARFYQDVYRYLYSMSHDAALSEELASEVFVEVVKSIAMFRGEADIRTWIFAIARHKWLAHLRREKRNPPAVELPLDLSSGKTPEEQLCDRETANRIRQLLEAEPRRTQRIMELRMEGYSFREIGKNLGISENSARVIHFRTKNRIQTLLKKEGYLNE